MDKYEISTNEAAGIYQLFKKESNNINKSLQFLAEILQNVPTSLFYSETFRKELFLEIAKNKNNSDQIVKNLINKAIEEYKTGIINLIDTQVKSRFSNDDKFIEFYDGKQASLSDLFKELIKNDFISIKDFGFLKIENPNKVGNKGLRDTKDKDRLKKLLNDLSRIFHISQEYKIKIKDAEVVYKYFDNDNFVNAYKIVTDEAVRIYQLFNKESKDVKQSLDLLTEILLKIPSSLFYTSETSREELLLKIAKSENLTDGHEEGTEEAEEAIEKHRKEIADEFINKATEEHKKKFEKNLKDLQDKAEVDFNKKMANSSNVEVYHENNYWSSVKKKAPDFSKELINELKEDMLPETSGYKINPKAIYMDPYASSGEHEEKLERIQENIKENDFINAEYQNYVNALPQEERSLYEEGIRHVLYTIGSETDLKPITLARYLRIKETYTDLAEFYRAISQNKGRCIDGVNQFFNEEESRLFHNLPNNDLDGEMGTKISELFRKHRKSELDKMIEDLYPLKHDGHEEPRNYASKNTYDAMGTILGLGNTVTKTRFDNFNHSLNAENFLKAFFINGDYLHTVPYEASKLKRVPVFTAEKMAEIIKNNVGVEDGKTISPELIEHAINTDPELRKAKDDWEKDPSTVKNEYFEGEKQAHQALTPKGYMKILEKHGYVKKRH